MLLRRGALSELDSRIALSLLLGFAAESGSEFPHGGLAFFHDVVRGFALRQDLGKYGIARFP